MENFIFQKSSNPKKKYDVFISAELWNKKRPNSPTNRPYKKISFGATGYEQFKDNTPLGIYSKLNHLDKNRREKYYKRHGKEAKIFSPKYFSHKYLW